MIISKYDVIDATGESVAGTFDHYDEAKRDADDRSSDTEMFAVIEMEFEYRDSALVYTTDGSNVWPPEDTGRES